MSEQHVEQNADGQSETQNWTMAILQRRRGCVREKSELRWPRISAVGDFSRGVSRTAGKQDRYG